MFRSNRCVSSNFGMPGTSSSSQKSPRVNLSGTPVVRRGKAAATTPPEDLRHAQAGDDEVKALLADVLRAQREQTEQFNRQMEEFLALSSKISEVIAENKVMAEKISALEKRLEKLEEENTSQEQEVTVGSISQEDGWRTVERSRGRGRSDRRKKFETLAEAVQEEMERVNRQCSIVLRGLPEQDTNASATADCDDLIATCASALHVDRSCIVAAERIRSSKRSSHPRLVRVKFTDRSAKMKVYHERFDLRVNGEPLYVSNDLTKQQQQARQECVPLYKQLREKKVECWLPYDVILKRDGTPFSSEEIARLTESQ